MTQFLWDEKTVTYAVDLLVTDTCIMQLYFTASIFPLSPSLFPLFLHSLYLLTYFFLLPLSYLTLPPFSSSFLYLAFA